MIRSITLLLAGIAASALTAGARTQSTPPHVLLISVDGMYEIDLQRRITGHPNGPLAALAARGIMYTNAETTAPSDSFPGLLAPVTGETPKSTISSTAPRWASASAIRRRAREPRIPSSNRRRG